MLFQLLHRRTPSPTSSNPSRARRRPRGWRSRGATRSWLSWDTSAPVTPSPRARQSGTLPYSSTTGDPLPVWYSACPWPITRPGDGSQVSVPPPCPVTGYEPAYPSVAVTGVVADRSCRVTGAVAGGGAPLPGPGRGGRGERPGPPRRHRPGRHHDHDAQGHPAATAARSALAVPRPPGSPRAARPPGRAKPSYSLSPSPVRFRLFAAGSPLYAQRVRGRIAHTEGPRAVAPSRRWHSRSCGDRWRMRLVVAHADYGDIEAGLPCSSMVGSGQLRHPVGAHALGELPVGGQHLLHQGLRTVAGRLALAGLFLERSGRVAGAGRRSGPPEHWVLLTPNCCAPPFGSCSAAAGVGVVRHAVGAHAVGVGDR